MYANICDELYMKQDEVEKYRQVIMNYKEQGYAVIVCRYVDIERMFCIVFCRLLVYNVY